MKNFLLKLLGLTALISVLAPSARAQGVANYAPYGPTVVPLCANTSNVFSFPANSTNYFPTNIVVTNIYTNAITSVITTNVVTNTISGIIDITKESSCAVQVGYICYSNAYGSNVIWQITPGLDTVNWDSNNTSFFFTNNPGSTAGQGSNAVVFTTNYSPLICGMIGYLKVNAVVNLNTNPIYAYLTNSGSGSLTFPTNNTGTNFQFMQYSAKRVSFQ